MAKAIKMLIQLSMLHLHVDIRLAIIIYPFNLKRIYQKNQNLSNTNSISFAGLPFEVVLNPRSDTLIRSSDQSSADISHFVFGPGLAIIQFTPSTSKL